MSDRTFFNNMNFVVIRVLVWARRASQAAPLRSACSSPCSSQGKEEQLVAGLQNLLQQERCILVQKNWISNPPEYYAGLAQLAEQSHCKRKVVCSIQTIGTTTTQMWKAPYELRHKPREIGKVTQVIAHEHAQRFNKVRVATDPPPARGSNALVLRVLPRFEEIDCQQHRGALWGGRSKLGCALMTVWGDKSKGR